MRLLILQETDWVKRYPAQQHHLAEMMSLRGHEVRAIDYELSWRKQGTGGLLSKRKIFNVTKIHQKATVTVIRPGFIKLPLLDYVSMLFSHWKEIKRQIKEFQPDAIIGFGILNSLTATMAVKKTSIPFIYYWIDALHLLIPTRIFSTLGKQVESTALKRSDRVFAINDSLKDLVVRMGAASGRTHVLRAGINITKFDLSIKGDEVRKQYGLKGNDIVLFFMGFLYSFAGLKEVAQKLAESGDNRLKLLIVGEGDAMSDLLEIRSKYKLQNSIILAGKKPYDEIPSHIAAADICLLPAYLNEPIMQDIVPIKLYEYMAMKKPVIATALPGVMREFGDGSGMIYIKGPEETIGKAMELVNSGKLDELGAKARSFAEINSWDKITDEFEKLLKEVIEEKHGKLS